MLALQIDLTDTIIQEAVTQKLENTQTVVWAVIGMIALFILLLVGKMVMTRIKNRDREESPKKPIIMVASIVAVVGVVGFLAFMLTSMKGTLTTNKKDQAHATEWHVEETKITKLEKDEHVTKKKRKNSRTYKERKSVYYYAQVDGIDGTWSISSVDYASLTEGEPVYVVVDYSGDVILFYSKDEYTYTGSKLQN